LLTGWQVVSFIKAKQLRLNAVLLWKNMVFVGKPDQMR
jgi:hypothetical protein